MRAILGSLLTTGGLGQDASTTLMSGLPSSGTMPDELWLYIQATAWPIDGQAKISVQLANVLTDTPVVIIERIIRPVVVNLMKFALPAQLGGAASGNPTFKLTTERKAGGQPNYAFEYRWSPAWRSTSDITGYGTIA